jgi:hypothetical protein
MLVLGKHFVERGKFFKCVELGKCLECQLLVVERSF